MGREGAVEFLELGFDDFRGCRDIDVIVDRVVGDIPGSVEDGTKDFEVETLDAFDVGLAEPHNSTRMALYIFILL